LLNFKLTFQHDGYRVANLCTNLPLQNLQNEDFLDTEGTDCLHHQLGIKILFLLIIDKKFTFITVFNDQYN